MQRCQWQKRGHAVHSLPQGQKAIWRRRLQQAYERPTYVEARTAMLRLRQELRVVNLSAAASLDEGFEETLTPHRLGLFSTLGTSVKTTNRLESLHPPAQADDRQGGPLAYLRGAAPLGGQRVMRH